MTNKWSQEYYIEAYSFAERAHRSYNQTITGTDVPYIAHPGFVCMEVMAALREIPDVYNENLAIQCALLHDTIEDTNVTYELLVEKFGIEVADGVIALTKDSLLPKSEQMMDSLRRIKQQPIEVHLVKLADRISNLRPPPHHWDKNKIAYYGNEGRLIYDVLKDANSYLASRLLSKIEEYKVYLEN